MFQQLIPVFVLAVAFVPAHAQHREREVVRTMHAQVEAHRAISYRMLARIKPSNLPDTLPVTETVHLMRVPNDSLFGGFLRASQGEGRFVLYDTKAVYEYDQARDSCTRYNIAAHQTWPMEGLNSALYWYQFLHPEAFLNWDSTSTHLALVGDTVMDGAPCYRLNVAFDDEGGIRERKRQYAIRKADHLPALMRERLIVEGDVQWMEQHMTDIHLGEGDSSLFDIRALAPHATTTDFVMPEHEPELAVGTPAPTLTGAYFPSSVAVEKDPWQGHVTFLDFWSMGCGPCRTSMPVVDSLYRVFRERGVRFIGINEYDLQAGRENLLREFLVQKNVTYPTLIAEEGLQDAFHVHAQPAFMIIDDRGLVAATYVGYGAGIEKVWAQKLEELLAK